MYHTMTIGTEWSEILYSLFEAHCDILSFELEYRFFVMDLDISSGEFLSIK